MEDRHAKPSRPSSPPPRPLKSNRRVSLTHLWQVLPQSDRQRTLLTLSRIVAQQLRRPPADKEADHEPT
jgi:hypothetical protein